MVKVRGPVEERIPVTRRTKGNTCQNVKVLVFYSQSFKIVFVFLLIRPILGGPPATPRTPARKGRAGRGARDLNAANMAESYFEAQSAKVRWVIKELI